jgi:hypothetical protein
MVIMDDLTAGYDQQRFLGRLFDGFALIVPAMGASLMRLLHFVAVGAFPERRLGQEIVRPARAGAAL